MSNSEVLKISKKRSGAVFGAVVGLVGAFVVDQLPSHAAPIQMMLYTIIVLAPLLLGLWPDRHHAHFWPGMAGSLALHCVVLYFIRSSFPFATVLSVIPIALAEIIALLVLMLKLLGDSGLNPNE